MMSLECGEKLVFVHFGVLQNLSIFCSNNQKIFLFGVQIETRCRALNIFLTNCKLNKHTTFDWFFQSCLQIWLSDRTGASA